MLTAAMKVKVNVKNRFSTDAVGAAGSRSDCQMILPRWAGRNKDKQRVPEDSVKNLGWTLTWFLKWNHLHLL